MAKRIRATSSRAQAAQPAPQPEGDLLDLDQAVVGVANLLVVNRSMPENLAYDITRVMFERQSELAAIHPEARSLSVDTATTGSPIPLHPGAVRFYKERGVLK